MLTPDDLEALKIAKKEIVGKCIRGVGYVIIFLSICHIYYTLQALPAE